MKLLLSTFLILITSFTALAQSERTKGIDLYEKGEYQEVIDRLEKTVKDTGKNHDLWLYIGMAYAKLDKTVQAVNAFKKDEAFSAMEVEGNDSFAKAKSRPNPKYTSEARRKNVQGFVKMAVEIDAEGRVVFAFPFETLPFGLTENAVKGAKSTTFTPAMKNGKGVSTIRLYFNGFSIY